MHVHASHASCKPSVVLSSFCVHCFSNGALHKLWCFQSATRLSLFHRLCCVRLAAVTLSMTVNTLVQEVGLRRSGIACICRPTSQSYQQPPFATHAASSCLPHHKQCDPKKGCSAGAVRSEVETMRACRASLLYCPRLASPWVTVPPVATNTSHSRPWICSAIDGVHATSPRTNPNAMHAVDCQMTSWYYGSAIISYTPIHTHTHASLDAPLLSAFVTEHCASPAVESRAADAVAQALQTARPWRHRT